MRFKKFLKDPPNLKSKKEIVSFINSITNTRAIDKISFDDDLTVNITGDFFSI